MIIIFLGEISCNCQYDSDGTTLVRLINGAEECEIDSSITQIASHAFQDQGHAIRYLSFANGSQLASVSEYGLSRLSKSIQLDLSQCHLLATLASNCFQGDSFASLLLPNPCKVTVLSPGTFGECKNLEEITIPPSVTILQSWTRENTFVFRGCSSLAHVYFTADSELITLGNHCLGGTALVSFTIPPTCKNIYANPFFSVSTLMSIDIDPRNPTFKSVDGIIFQKNKLVLHTFPPGREVNYTIPDGYIIGDGAFKGTRITGIIFSDAITEVPWHGFAYCSLLKTVINTKNIVAFRDSSFAGDSKIQEMEISSLATVFEFNSFTGLRCNSLIIKNYIPAMKEGGITEEMFHKCPSLRFTRRKKTMKSQKTVMRLFFHVSLRSMD